MQFQGKMQEKAVDYKTALILWRVQGQTARASVPSLLQLWKRTNVGDASSEEWQMVLRAAHGPRCHHLNSSS